MVFNDRSNDYKFSENAVPVYGIGIPVSFRLKGSGGSLSHSEAFDAFNPSRE